MRVRARWRRVDQVDEGKVVADTMFKDLGLDSLDTVEVVMAIEARAQHALGRSPRAML